MTKHRADVPVKTRAQSLRFMPRHCAGVTCVHNHPIDVARGLALGTVSLFVRRRRGAA